MNNHKLRPEYPHYFLSHARNSIWGEKVYTWSTIVHQQKSYLSRNILIFGWTLSVSRWFGLVWKYLGHPEPLFHQGTNTFFLHHSYVWTPNIIYTLCYYISILQHYVILTYLYTYIIYIYIWHMYKWDLYNVIPCYRHRLQQLSNFMPSFGSSGSSLSSCWSSKALLSVT